MALRRIIVSLGAYDHRFIGDLEPGVEGRLRERLGALRLAGQISDYSIESYWVADNMAELPVLLDRLEHPETQSRRGSRRADAPD